MGNIKRSITKLFLIIAVLFIIQPAISFESSDPAMEELNSLYGRWWQNYWATHEVRHYFYPEDVKIRYNYCANSSDPSAMTCGSLVFFHSHPGFMYNFSSLERQVGAIEYFIPNQNGTYRAYLDDIFDGKVYIDYVYQENQQLKVSFVNGLPHIEQIRLKVHGSSRYGRVGFKFFDNRIEIKGFVFDEKDSSVKIPVELLYTRVIR